MESITATMPIEQPQIKYESPYSADPPPYDPHQHSPLKRRFSPSTPHAPASDEKRQRIEVSPPALGGDDMDFAAMIAAAAATASEEAGPAPPQQQHQMQQHQQHSFAPQEPLPSVEGYQAGQEFGGSREAAAEISNGFSADPHLYMRILSLPILESLSTQILSTLAQGPYSETIKIVTQPESELGQAYATLKSLFDQTKKIYSQQKPFLSADELNIREPEHRGTIRTTNLATFVSSVVGGQDVGFYELNDHFIETFVADGAELQTEPGLLYLNLKTQMYLSAVSQEEQERTKDEVLDDLFPVSLGDTLRARHPGSDLTQSEIEFVKEANARREYLQNDSGDPDSISILSEQYAWEDFLKNLSDHLKKAYEPLIAPYMRRHALTAPPPSLHTQQHQHPNPTAEQQTSPKPPHDPQQPPQQHPEPELDLGDLDIEQATRAATQHALQSIGYSQYDRQQQTQPQQQHLQQQHQQHAQQMTSYAQEYPAGAVPYHTQTAPTQVLYEQARQAAVAKASPHSRRPGLPSQRRPWSTEEENALMAGLDQVKGPHWSQILALYGAKGQVSEILKDRNQVQLKDKARNLKLFFLKSNIEVPYYLQCVTGELKTRAPSQAARKEAEERARLASDEEQARFNGIMALAGGMQEGGLGMGGQGEMHGGHHLQQQMDGLQQQQQQQQQRGDEQQQQFDGQHQQHGQLGQQGEVNQSPRGQGQIGAQGQQQAGGQEVSQLDFEDALGARLMESLEDHDKRAASVTTS
ncbi:TTAGGG repeat binding factor [Pseudogymnoascus verrucosus]|uniref:TTAGGG repeat binding factor n=1 Tax=Pseudogymnoascus verrucosus TaxID=342668 RepID=A0A1B8GQQ9_9PEZI|nr:TTAGGG repeat binding factor [Pseudogymnoascus verrucosus]OBT98169.2 TTAGGG repeat binding factor [Pseudogymnoascus verrucosus]